MQRHHYIALDVGSLYLINASSTALDNVNVQYSTAGDAASPFACDATCYNAGNNTNWAF